LAHKGNEKRLKKFHVFKEATGGNRYFVTQPGEKVRTQKRGLMARDGTQQSKRKLRIKLKEKEDKGEKRNQGPVRGVTYGGKNQPNRRSKQDVVPGQKA